MTVRRATGRRAAAAIVALTAAALLSGCAEPKPPSAFEQDFDDVEKPWKEVESQLPPPPIDANLVGFSVSGATQYRFQLDANALSIGTDGVYRYTLVATSPQGVRNVSYEGIRCETHEHKLYAVARTDGSWVRARNAAWQPIVDISLNRTNAALDREYFCPDGYAARDTKTIIARMQPALAPSEATYDREGQAR